MRLFLAAEVPTALIATATATAAKRDSAKPGVRRPAYLIALRTARLRSAMAIGLRSTTAASI